MGGGHPRGAYLLIRLMFALIDCNNFYCACEMVFRPDLNGQAVVVLSNNDGCIIARNQYAKDLGIKMGTALYQIKTEPYFNQLHIFSSNYALYADMSNRFINTLKSFGYYLDVYSIDEVFMEIHDDCDLNELGNRISKTVEKHIGLPVTVGIAKTKTLAKLATHIAKKSKRRTLCFHKNESIEQYLKHTAIEDIWGIGNRWSKKCKRLGITTAEALIHYPQKPLLKQFNKIMGQIQYELQGMPCIEFNQDTAKSIRSSRSFLPEITDIDTLLSAMNFLGKQAIHKLHQSNQSCSLLSVFIRSNPFKTPYYSNAKTICLTIPLQGHIEILSKIRHLCKYLYLPSFHYKKAGVLLHGLEPKHHVPLPIFDTQTNTLEQSIQTLHQKYGKNSIKWASDLLFENHRHRPSKASPKYTTQLSDILEVS